MVASGELLYVNGIGDSVQLHSPSKGRYVTEAMEGTDIPPVEFKVSEPYDKDGSLLRTARFQDRVLMIPMALVGSTSLEVRERTRALASKLNPRLGDGVLYFCESGDQGPWRALKCRYSEGLEGIHERLVGTETWYDTVVTFRAFDPLWFDPIPMEVVFTLEPDLAHPFFPMFDDANDVGPHFGEGTSLEDVTIANGGDQTAWPVWTLVGPMTAPLLTNETTGEEMNFATLTIAAGHSVTIDTTQGYVTAVTDQGVNVLNTMTAASVPFGLAVGNNTISGSATGTDENSLISFTWSTRWLSI